MSKKVAIIILISFIVVSSIITNFLKHTYETKVSDDFISQKEEVEDKEPPILELKYDKLILYLDDELDYESIILEAYDNKDGNLLSKVKYMEIDTTKLGIQELEYVVKDSSGNETKEKVQVTILDKLPEYGE